MDRKILLRVAGPVLIILLVLVFLNAEYATTKIRSVLIRSSIEDIPSDGAPQEPPLLLLHGFTTTYSKRVSEFSLYAMQKALAHDLRYRDQGLLIPETTCAELRYAAKPIIVRASYLNGVSNATIHDYAGNVAQMIERIKYCTGASQVDVVTHSMGGIVMRHYLRTNGTTSVRKFVMLATPNHGGLYHLGDIADYLAKKEEVLDIDFLQLSEHHPYMKWLNEEEKIPGVEVVTIAGLVDGQGDGLVLADSVPIDGSHHVVVPCNHVFIKRPALCPKAYQEVVAALSSTLLSDKDETTATTVSLS
ncbi:alpha/beta fold hydrolase [Candidatus Woesearchaeota archaeon]|nr:alpha/beta fold hydrolase [Candidatus Woesearchaeota archaeon]